MTHPEPLNKQELQWLRRFERVLKDMPARLWLVESGDALTLVDRPAARRFPLHDGHSANPRVWLANVKHGTMKVTGVSG